VEICESARNAGNGRRIYITAENEPQLARVLRAPETGGFGIDAVWNDDLHHSLVVAATGTADAYYSETRGTPQELISGIKWGFLYQGQYFAWQKQPRGSPVLDMEACRFISFLQNHDQVANSARGLRLHALTSPGRMRALTALLLLSPATPLLFQGQEFAADSPFLFFAGHQGELAEQVRAGRAEFLRQFPNLAGGDRAKILSNPENFETFEACKLRHEQRVENAHVLAMHRSLLQLRRGDAVFSSQDAGRLHGAVLGPEAFALRFLGENGDDRLIVVNLGTVLPLSPMPEPLLAPPENTYWSVLWHSEDARWGGSGMRSFDEGTTWTLPAHALAVFHASKKEQR
jgi:maltooligosyltrehalose trehalohydrolase